MDAAYQARNEDISDSISGSCADSILTERVFSWLSLQVPSLIVVVLAFHIRNFDFTIFPMNSILFQRFIQTLLVLFLTCITAAAQSPSPSATTPVPAITGTIAITSPTPAGWRPPLISFDSGDAIYVTGLVKRPGSQPFTPDVPLHAYAAILNAGGFTRYADIKKIYVLRQKRDGTKIKIQVDVEAIQHARIPDIPLKKNDQVIVPEKFFSF